MCIFKASYIGGNSDVPLKMGRIYNVKRYFVNDKGKGIFILEGIEGEYDERLFRELQNKGRHYLVNGKVPKVGGYMRLVKSKNDMKEFMTGAVQEVEKTKIPGVYKVYTEKCVYEVSAII